VSFECQTAVCHTVEFVECQSYWYHSDKHFVECQIAKCPSVRCHSTECHSIESHSVECK
jgi:hypothetical protein